MKITERTLNVRSIGTFALLVATTVVAAGTPIVLARHLADRQPARPAPIVDDSWGHKVDR